MRAVAFAVPLVAAVVLAQTTERGGPPGGTLVPTGQLVRPAGESLSFPGPPVDLALAPDGKHLFVKDNRGVVVLDLAAWKVAQQLPFPGDKVGGSMHGLAVRADGKRLYATTAQDLLCEAEIDGGRLKWARSIRLPGPDNKGASHATGIALTRDGKRAYVCLSRNNALGVVDLEKGVLAEQVPVGVAPFAVALSGDERTAFVSNWGGRRPNAGERTAPSSGTPVLVDARGVASSGTVGRVDLGAGRMRREVETGLHPAGLALSADGKKLYVANANSDTVTVLDAAALSREKDLVVRPDPKLPFGSATNALALSRDGKALFAANGGNNAVAVIGLGGKPAVEGFIPAGWYPGAVTCDDKYLYVANVKGEGSRTRDPKRAGFGVYGYTGTVTRVPFPTAKQLADYTAQVRKDARVPEALRALERGDSAARPVPVPARVGEPSVIEHVVYVIKENRTYDQVFGDLKQGNGDPSLCIFPRELSPNHHALAEQFVLLDNFYCNGVLSADGHSWTTEGNVTDHLERAFGGFTRSYTFGDDPLTYSSTGFLWDNALLRGRSFRNYGEMRDSETTVPAKATFTDIWRDYRSGKGKVAFQHKMYLDPLARYTAPDYPGWGMKVTDQQRLDAFLREFREFEKRGGFPNLVIVYLPQDHTSGTQPGMPTPRAHMADNDLAVGRLVEAISHSRFWPKAAIFMIEDDPQDGYDHVDGHRSVCLVVSPHARRKAVVSRFYNQTGVLHTMERILGLPPMTQLDGLAPLMTECFTERPDFTPYKAITPKAPLDELNRPLKELKGKDRDMALLSLAQDLSKPDRIDDGAFNEIVWHAMNGEARPYPKAWAGAHGRGLKALGLRLVNGRPGR
ncbi:MAG: alkaline phosphatase family protein [Gemmataceae bacterium]